MNQRVRPRPCGKFMAPSKGRYVIGREVLALMGVPIHKMVLRKTAESASRPVFSFDCCILGATLFGWQRYCSEGVSPCFVCSLEGVQRQEDVQLVTNSGASKNSLAVLLRGASSAQLQKARGGRFKTTRQFGVACRMCRSIVAINGNKQTTQCLHFNCYNV